MEITILNYDSLKKQHFDLQFIDNWQAENSNYIE